MLQCHTKHLRMYYLFEVNNTTLGLNTTEYYGISWNACERM